MSKGYEEVNRDSRGTYTMFVIGGQDCSDEELSKDFGTCGEVVEIHRPADSAFLFVRFARKEDAIKALSLTKYKIKPARIRRRNTETVGLNSSRWNEEDRESRSSVSKLENKNTSRKVDSTNGKIFLHKSLDHDVETELSHKISDFSLAEPLDDGPPPLVPADDDGPPPLICPFDNVPPFVRPSDIDWSGPVLKPKSEDDGLDMPCHADELIVSNMSEETTADDLLELFAHLQPLYISAKGYTPNYGFTYRVIKFQTAKDVTAALKIFHNYFLHGNLLTLARLSTLIEFLE